jgi:hypothetical protein
LGVRGSELRSRVLSRQSRRVGKALVCGRSHDIEPPRRRKASLYLWCKSGGEVGTYVCRHGTLQSTPLKIFILSLAFFMGSKPSESCLELTLKRDSSIVLA